MLAVLFRAVSCSGYVDNESSAREVDRKSRQSRGNDSFPAKMSGEAMIVGKLPRALETKFCAKGGTQVNPHFRKMKILWVRTVHQDGRNIVEDVSMAL